MKKSGFSLLELLVVVTLGLVVVFVLSGVMTTAFRGSSAVTWKGDLETEITELAEHILKVGRFAQQCLKPQPSTLECQVDFSAPPSGTTEKVHFILNGTSVSYEKEVSGTWNLLLTYRDIAAFDICNDSDMTAGTCNLEPTGISLRHTANLSAPPPASGVPPSIATAANHFFRFRIVGRSQSKNATDFQGKYQSAFFVRNPSPQSDLTYSWGTTQ